MSGRWLTIIGIGEDGLDGLAPTARRLIDAAEFIAGGARHLDLLGGHDATLYPWPSPLTDAIPVLLARRGRPTLVLASGDPFHWGIGVTLARHTAAAEIRSLPAASAFSLAANRLGWPLQDCVTLSLHGRPHELLFPHLQPGARVLALSWDGDTPARIADAMAARGFGRSTITVLEAMGGPKERVRTSAAEPFAITDVMPLNTLAIEVVAARDALILPRAGGLPDTYFEHDGQLTKRAVRAVALSALQPRPGELLWDIGAGAGSIGIEWMLAHPANRAIAIESEPTRVGRIGSNASRLGVPDLRIIQGRAPEALADLPPPEAIFIGGGSSDPSLLDAALNALRAGGRLVANAVTLEGQTELARRHERLGGELLRLDCAAARPVGRYRAWRPAMPVHQWTFIAGEGSGA